MGCVRELRASHPAAPRCAGRTLRFTRVWLKSWLLPVAAAGWNAQLRRILAQPPAPVASEWVDIVRSSGGCARLPWTTGALDDFLVVELGTGAPLTPCITSGGTSDRAYVCLAQHVHV